jgi:hypothetical protein
MAALAEPAVPAKVTRSHVAYLRSCADAFWTRDQAVGGGALLRQAVRQWRRARRMLDESDYPELVGRDLLKVTGDLAVCTGWLAFDAGDVPLARRMYSEAMFVMNGAGDPLLAAHALSASSMLSSYLAGTGGGQGTARDALRLADQAASAAVRERMPGLHAKIALRRATAASLLGDERGFKAEIGRARSELDRGVSADDPAWIRFVDEFEVDGHEANGYMNLGQPRVSAELRAKSLGRPGMRARNRTVARARLASALAACGDVTGAVSEGLAVLPAFEDGLTSTRALNDLRPVRRAASSLTSAEEFRARFDAAEQALKA